MGASKHSMISMFETCCLVLSFMRVFPGAVFILFINLINLLSNYSLVYSTAVFKTAVAGLNPFSQIKATRLKLARSGKADVSN